MDRKSGVYASVIYRNNPDCRNNASFKLTLHFNRDAELAKIKVIELLEAQIDTLSAAVLTEITNGTSAKVHGHVVADESDANKKRTAGDIHRHGMMKSSDLAMIAPIMVRYMLTQTSGSQKKKFTDVLGKKSFVWRRATTMGNCNTRF